MGTLLIQLGAAFLGGIILNVMPCVLPVLTMKVFHLIEHRDADPRANKLHGLAYTGGILLAMGGFATIVLALIAAGRNVVWGAVLFGNPPVIAGLTILMLVLGLNALGVFEFTVSVQGSQSEGYKGSFSNGIVATLMALPCSAPFLGSAAGYALTVDSWGITLAIFLMIGFGLAFPFLLISFVPTLGRLLPRPGAWMESFKHMMGFTLLAAAVWLFGVLLKAVTPSASNWFLALLLLIGMGLWAINRFGALHHSTVRRYGVRLAVLASVLAFGFTFVSFDIAAKNEDSSFVLDQSPVKDDKIQWVEWKQAYIDISQKQLRPVFVDYTADW